ncbi:polysaccharide pyruvyl transferase family protein [Thalassotalea profundi]|uniref:Polysaccharide pyruvyl transferase domain-containing protein n=1 Tax=Thalassotalea profundi TaxID=2036687 RepID=A0ABQ3IP65_9GAMM|nr:polysaccharide pyruvyl transferase family protein [Thalassotalea profundi]GHE89435.1 hypothetical protein GCM10011501_18730 [Thalassotalea profundi]
MHDIILYGAFDRHNYGDLLFPLIMKRVIEQELPQKKVLVTGLINSDLSKYGALPTVSIRKALKYSKDNATIILAGGDVIACNWQSAYGYLLPHYLTPVYKRFSYHFPKLTKELVSRMFGLTSELPFNLNRNDLGALRTIIYNSVGATEVANLKNTDKILSLGNVITDTSYISVRDTFSQTQLRRLGNHSTKVVPDSATIMSSVITVAELEEKSSNKTKRMLEKYIEGYIVFQISQSHIKGNEQAFARELSKISQVLKLPIVFIAIGNAAGHNDSKGINKVISFMDKGTGYDTYLSGNIFDLMNIIRNSSCYCGTSLHGLITAMSFEVPRVALLPKLRKQINYMDTWDLSHMPRGVKPENLSKSIGIAMATPNKDLKQLAHQLTNNYMVSFRSISSTF